MGEAVHGARLVFTPAEVRFAWGALQPKPHSLSGFLRFRRRSRCGCRSMPKGPKGHPIVAITVRKR